MAWNEAVHIKAMATVKVFLRKADNGCMVFSP
jgi:hypothetical protein